MRELSLFTGAGGGVLGSKILGWRTLGYVEKDEYCQKIIMQRIEDGIFDDAPIFSDVGRFISEGFAESYRGRVDVVSAGFPCQPFSVSGKRRGELDERNLWPQTIECIRKIRPPFAFLENVPGLLSSGYFGRILGDLAESGYCVYGQVLGSKDAGGTIVGNRLWLLASSNCKHNFSDEAICSRSNKAFNFRLRDSWPAIQNADTAWLLSNGFVMPETNELAEWVDELKPIGNGQDPILMAYAFSKLFERFAG